MKISYPPGATPLDPDDMEGLIPGLTTHGELNEFEAGNILNAQRRLSTNPGLLRAEILTDTGLRRLHEHMFDETWRWAGQYRKRLTNIGVDAGVAANETA